MNKVTRVKTRERASLNLGSRGGIGIFSIILLMIYMLFSWDRLGGPSPNNHFAYLAESFLAGQVSLKTPPPHGNDWASYEVVELKTSAKKKVESTLKRPIKELRGIYLPKTKEHGRSQHIFETLSGERLKIDPRELSSRKRQYFVSFPPLPALLMSPLVAVFGLASSDIWFTLLFAVLNGILAYQLFAQVIHDRERSKALQPQQHIKVHTLDPEALWLAVSLSLGTAHFWCAVRGEVWFTALIVGVSCQLLFFRWAWRMKAPLLAGIAYACAFSTRASLITLGLFAYLQYFSLDGNARQRLRRLAVFTIPPFIVGCLLLYYNHIRFERWYEFGHRYLAGGQLSRISTYGLFNVVFIKKNLIAAFGLLPLISTSAPLLTYSWHGMALQLSSPHLLYAVFRPSSWSSISETEVKRERVIVWTLKAMILTTLTLLLLYQNTGWVQYSWRFALDVIPGITLLIALSGRAQGRLFKGLVIWGILINLIGALIFGRNSLWWSALNLPILTPH